jgi:type VI secretion system protein ImpJ
LTRAKEIPAAVQWHEGMLLAPQHFQQHTLRQEELLHFHLRRGVPYYWGIHTLRFDPVLLREGLLRVLELEAVMPDGLVVSHEPVKPEDLQVELAPHAEAAKSGPLMVHLAVVADKRGSTGDDSMSRYVSTTSEPLSDQNTKDGALAIAQLKPRLQLIVGTPPARYCALPLLAIRNEGESFRADEYIPPQLAVTPNSALADLCTRVARRVREKAMYLLDAIKAPSSAAERSLLEEHKPVIQTLVTQLPSFESLMNAGTVHPFQMYVSLCALAGQLASLGQALVPPVFSTYDHDDARRTFAEVSDFIFKVLEEGIPEAFTRVIMRMEKDAFATRFLQDWGGRELVIGVVGQRGSTEKQLLEWVAGCRIGSESRQRRMREMRVLGAHRQVIERREGLVPKRGMMLFSVEADAKFITPNELLVLENAADQPSLTRPAEISLYVRNGA